MGSKELSSLLKKTGPEHSDQEIWVGACMAALTSGRSKYRGTRPGYEYARLVGNPSGSACNVGTSLKFEKILRSAYLMGLDIG